MPLIAPSSYHAPWLLRNGHLQTLYASLCRRAPRLPARRERVVTPDDDFLDLDWLGEVRSDRLAVLSHGLEGNTSRTYIAGMATALHRRGWDVLAWNCRGCSGTPNKQLRFYHSGATEDLDTVVQHVAGQGRHRDVALVGFSLGGNLTLKYVGEQGPRLLPAVKAAVAFSVPCDLASSSRRMATFENRIYMTSFLRSLRRKIVGKARLLPGQLQTKGYGEIRTFQDFDNRYTAPLHGFLDAQDYWRRASSNSFLGAIGRPTLLVNAADDPFLGPECFPFAAAEGNPHFHLEIPASGGHAGFVSFERAGEYWSETRAAAFLAEALGLGQPGLAQPGVK